MLKFIKRLFFLLLTCIIVIIIYLSYFGLKTDKFNNLIKDEANKINRFVKLGFKETKIYLNLKELNLVVKLQNPKILVKSNEIILSKLDFYLAIKAFISNDFLLQRAEISFSKNSIKDITKITNIFFPKVINKQFNKIFLKGNLEGKFIIPFDSNGSIEKNYGFAGKISNASINITKEFPIRKLTMEISHIKNFDDDLFKLTIKKGFLHQLGLENSEINLKKIKNEYQIDSLLHTNGKFEFSQIEKIISLFNLNNKNVKSINGIVDLNTQFKFNINNRFKIKNLSTSTEGIIKYLETEIHEKKILKRYIPNFNSKLIIKDTKIKLINTKVKQILNLKGFIKTKNNFNNFSIKEKYYYDKKRFEINGIVDLTNTEVSIPNLNFSKKSGKKSEINFDINFSTNKYCNIKKLNFLDDKNKINLTDVKLNKNFEVEDFKKLEVKTYKNKVKNNDFVVNKAKGIIASGKVFDAQSILKSLFTSDDKKFFSRNFVSDIKINFKKALTGTNDDVHNFSMIAKINKGSYDKLSLKGNYSNNEIIEMSIYQIDKDKKTLHVISDRARPFIKNFDFVEGFEGGKLEYESIISKDITNSSLIITDFKVSKVPALAKLLTLASLQGIADTLSGEGIRFESFEMKSNSKDNIMNIEDALAMGPAISILLEGYVDKGKVVSLRGTLVPATKLNSIIATIPLVGDILVGKKTGEGVVGVSFKMKGPPKDIKTSVNPIKTLTPRFIVRAIEKIKKKKKDETK